MFETKQRLKEQERSKKAKERTHNEASNSYLLPVDDLARN